MKKLVILLTVLSLLLIGCNQGKASQGTPAGTSISAPLDSHLSFSGYGGKRIYGDLWVAQVFTPSKDWEMQSVRLKLWVEGLVPEFQVELVSVIEGSFGKAIASSVVPTGTLVVNDPGTMVEVLLASKLVGGQKYAIVVYTGDGNEFNTIRWVYDTGGTGGFYYSNNGGSDWYQMADRDFIFEVRGTS